MTVVVLRDIPRRAPQPAPARVPVVRGQHRALPGCPGTIRPTRRGRAAHRRRLVPLPVRAALIAAVALSLLGMRVVPADPPLLVPVAHIQPDLGGAR